MLLKYMCVCVYLCVWVNKTVTATAVMPRHSAEWVGVPERWWCPGLARARSSARYASHKGADAWREPFPLHAASCLSSRRNRSLFLSLSPPPAAPPHLPARPTDRSTARSPVHPPVRCPWIPGSAPLRPRRDKKIWWTSIVKWDASKNLFLGAL